MVRTVPDHSDPIPEMDRGMHAHGVCGLSHGIRWSTGTEPGSRQ